MATTGLDPRAFKDEQRGAWDAISRGWETAQEVFERGARAMTRRLLELGGVRPGQSVLDVGAGLGEPALSAARLVREPGRVLGVDLSPRMVEAARRRAAGLGNVEFVEGDVESIRLPDASFDVVLSRWGLMFVLDQAATFSALRRLLVPGGVLAASVWGPPQTAPMLHLGYAAMARRLALPAPPPGRPGPFSMSDPVQLTETVTGAGFVEVSVTEFVVPFRLASVSEYVEFNRSVSPPALLGRIEDRFGSVDAPDFWTSVARAVEPYASDEGVELASTALCLRAVAPG